MLDVFLDLLQNNRDIAGFLLFGLGASMASFIGLAVDRLPHQMGWRENPQANLTLWSPRSHCPKCERKLGFLELIPLAGWLANMGRCFGCKQSVPWVYPVSELMLGLLTASCIYIFGYTLEALAFIALLWVSLFLSWMDMNEQWLPAIVTTPLLWAGLLLSPFEADAQMRIVGAVIGGGGLVIAFWIASYIKKVDAYSGGDVALMACGGAWLGAAGLFDFILLGSLFLLAHAIPMQARGEVWIPMGPSLCLSLLTVAALRSHEIGIVVPV